MKLYDLFFVIFAIASCHSEKGTSHLQLEPIRTLSVELGNEGDPKIIAYKILD